MGIAQLWRSRNGCGYGFHLSIGVVMREVVLISAWDSISCFILWGLSTIRRGVIITWIVFCCVIGRESIS